MTKQMKADVGLLLVAMGWGANFIFTKNALSDLATFNFLSIRFIMAFILCALFFRRKFRDIDKKTLQYSILAGVALFSCYGFNTLGLVYTTISKCAFITGASVVMVPLFLSVALKKRPESYTIAGSILAFGGLGLMTLNSYQPLNIGDFLSLMAAIMAAVHIIMVGSYARKCNALLLGVLQIGVVGVLSTVATFLFEKPYIPAISPLWINLILVSIFCTAGAFIILSVAQQFTPPAHAAVILTAEPVFAAIFAYLLMGDVLSLAEIAGAILTVLGILASELGSLFPSWKKEANQMAP